MSDMRDAIGSTVSALIAWQNETGGANDAHDTLEIDASDNPEIETEVAVTKDTDKEHGETANAKSATDNATDGQRHIRWGDDDGQPIEVKHESIRTHYEFMDGRKKPSHSRKRPNPTWARGGLGAEQAVARARARVMRKAVRQERAAKEWKTLT